MPTKRVKLNGSSMKDNWYNEYLKSAHWIAFRRRVKKTRNKCEKCGSKKRLNVHHLHYETLWNETEADVLVLCRVCHEIAHNIKVKKKKKKKANQNKKCVVCNLPRGYISANGFYIGGRKKMCLDCFAKWGNIKDWKLKVNRIKKRELLDIDI